MFKNVHNWQKVNESIIQSIITVFTSAKFILYSHKKFNDSVPKWPEVDEQHCDEVTQRHLKEERPEIII